MGLTTQIYRFLGKSQISCPATCICFCIYYLYEMTMAGSFAVFCYFSSLHWCHCVQHFLTLVYLVGIWVTPICQAILFLNWGTLSTCNICESDKTLLPCLSFSVLHNQVVHKLIKLICKMKTSLSILHLYFPSLILEMSEEEPSLILLPLFHLYFPHAISWLENLVSNYENAHMVCAAVKGSYWDFC